MPHHTASPKKSSFSSEEKTPSLNVKPKIAFVITSNVAPLNRREMLWDAILKDDVKQLNTALKSDLKTGLIITFIGADFSKEYQGENALTLAAKLRRHRIIKKIINVVGSTAIKNTNGDTALHIAVKNQDYDTTLVLLQQKADYRVLNNDKVNVLELAHALRLHAGGIQGYKLAEQIEILIRNYSYQYNELKFEITVVTAADRNQRIKELRDQKIDPTEYLSKVYVR